MNLELKNTKRKPFAILAAALIIVLALDAIYIQNFFWGPLARGAELSFKKDFSGAFSIYMPLAQQGNPSAQLYIAHAYEKGNGVTEDAGEAQKWLERSAQQGFSPAQYELSSFYERNGGSDKKEKSYYWSYIAAMSTSPLISLPSAIRHFSPMQEVELFHGRDLSAETKERLRQQAKSWTGRPEEPLLKRSYSTLLLVINMVFCGCAAWQINVYNSKTTKVVWSDKKVILFTVLYSLAFAIVSYLWSRYRFPPAQVKIYLFATLYILPIIQFLPPLFFAYCSGGNSKRKIIIYAGAVICAWLLPYIFINMFIFCLMMLMAFAMHGA